VPDESTPARGTEDLQSELAQSREAATRLMDNLARRIGASRTVRHAASGIERAAHLVDRDWKDVAGAVARAVRGRPGTTMIAGMLAGFLIGRALRPR
jgi:hypothetical protein